MMELPVHDRQGNVVETLQFDETCLGKFVNMRLLHQAVVMYEANRRTGTAKTKALREVVGSSQKPYRQKGTGRARMGSRRRAGSRGGYTAHGPKPRDYRQAMSKKARRSAARSALLGKLRDSEVVVIDDLAMQAPKTRELAAVLKSLKADTGCLVVIPEHDETIWKSLRNIPKTDLSSLRELNARSLLLRKTVLFTKAALQAIPKEFC